MRLCQPENLAGRFRTPSLSCNRPTIPIRIRAEVAYSWSSTLRSYPLEEGPMNQPPTNRANGMNGQDLASAGLSGVSTVHWKLGAAALYEHVMRRGEAKLTRYGALVATTGTRTGRSPQDRFIVQESSSEA